MKLGPRRWFTLCASIVVPGLVEHADLLAVPVRHAGVSRHEDRDLRVVLRQHVGLPIHDGIHSPSYISATPPTAGPRHVLRCDELEPAVTHAREQRFEALPRDRLAGTVNGQL
jgi:hypothetical protein